jgi:hypothetical protein
MLPYPGMLKIEPNNCTREQEEVEEVEVRMRVHSEVYPWTMAHPMGETKTAFKLYKCLEPPSNLYFLYFLLFFQSSFSVEIDFQVTSPWNPGRRPPPSAAC